MANFKDQILRWFYNNFPFPTVDTLTGLNEFKLYSMDPTFPTYRKSERVSHTVIKEKPRKRPSAPPNSATKDCQV